MINKAFGEWDAPVTDDAEWIDTPVGDTCVWCQEKIKEGDNGRKYGGYSITLDANGKPEGISDLWTEHKECSFRNVMGGIGHLVDHERYCHGKLGTDAGLSRRESSLLVWEYFQTTRLKPTPAQIVVWREKLEKKHAKLS